MTSKRNSTVRTCSVCGTEIDKTTAYTKTGEQKPQGRRCVNCVDGVSAEVKSTDAPQTTTEAPTSAPQPETQATVTPQQIPATNDAGEGESSTMKYMIGAILVAVVLWLVIE